MNEKTLRALIEAGAVKRLRIVADGGRFRVEVDTAASTQMAMTTKGAPRTWGTIDASAKWLRGLGIGTAQLQLERWQPGQKSMGF